MRKVVTFTFYIVLIILFVLFQDFAKNYRKFIIIPHSIYHKTSSNHVAGDLKEKMTGKVPEEHKEHHHHHSLDYIHTRILNHPWNNRKIIEMMLLQGLFYAILASILIKKVFYE